MFALTLSVPTGTRHDTALTFCEIVNFKTQANTWYDPTVPPQHSATVEQTVLVLDPGRRPSRPHLPILVRVLAPVKHPRRHRHRRRHRLSMATRRSTRSHPALVPGSIHRDLDRVSDLASLIDKPVTRSQRRVGTVSAATTRSRAGAAGAAGGAGRGTRSSRSRPPAESSTAEDSESDAQVAKLLSPQTTFIFPRPVPGTNTRTRGRGVVQPPSLRSGGTRSGVVVKRSESASEDLPEEDDDEEEEEENEEDAAETTLRANRVPIPAPLDLRRRRSFAPPPLTARPPSSALQLATSRARRSSRDFAAFRGLEDDEDGRVGEEGEGDVSIAVHPRAWRRGMRSSLGGIVLPSTAGSTLGLTSPSRPRSLAASTRPVDLTARVYVLDMASSAVLMGVLGRAEAFDELEERGMGRWGHEEERAWKFLSATREAHWTSQRYISPATVPSGLYPPSLSLGPSSSATLALRKSNLASFLASILRPSSNAAVLDDEDDAGVEGQGRKRYPSDKAMSEAIGALSQLVVPKAELLSTGGMELLVRSKIQRHISRLRSSLSPASVASSADWEASKKRVERSFGRRLEEHLRGEVLDDREREERRREGGEDEGAERSWKRLCDEAKRKILKSHDSLPLLERMFPFDTYVQETVNYLKHLYRSVPLVPPPVPQPFVVDYSTVSGRRFGGEAEGGEAVDAGGGKARGGRGKSQGTTAAQEGGRNTSRAGGRRTAAGGPGGAGAGAPGPPPPPGGPGGPADAEVEDDGSEDEEEEGQSARRRKGKGKASQQSQVDSQSQLSYPPGSQEARHHENTAAEMLQHGIEQRLLEELLARGNFDAADDPGQYIHDLGDTLPGTGGAPAVDEDREGSGSSPEVELRMSPPVRRGNHAAVAIDPRLQTTAAGAQNVLTSAASVRHTARPGAIRFGQDNVLYRAPGDPAPSTKRFLNQRTADAERIEWDSQPLVPQTPGQPSATSNQPPSHGINVDIPTGYDDHEMHRYIDYDDGSPQQPPHQAQQAGWTAAGAGQTVVAQSQEPETPFPDRTVIVPASISKARDQMARSVNAARGRPDRATPAPGPVAALAPPSQRPGNSSFTAMLVPDDGHRGGSKTPTDRQAQKSSKARAREADSTDADVDTLVAPRPKKRRAAVREATVDSGGFQDGSTDDTDLERARAKQTRPLAAHANARRLHRDIVVSQGSVLVAPPVDADDEDNDGEDRPSDTEGDGGGASARRDRHVGRTYDNPDKFRHANQDHWTRPQEELLIQEVEMFYDRYDCMAHIISRHGDKGTISHAFGGRHSVQLKDKAVNLSTRWYREGTELTELRSKAFGRFPPKQLRGAQGKKTLAMVEMLSNQRAAS